MTIPVLGLSTFLKLTVLSPADQLRDVQAYADPGGYDRYWSFKDSAKELVQHHKSIDQAVAKILSLSNESERKDNHDLLMRLVEWRKKNPLPGFLAPEGLWTSPNQIFAVRVSPEIAMFSNKERYILSAYCHKSIRISPTAAGMGVIIMRKALAGKHLVGDKIGILDLISGRRMMSIPKFANTAFPSQVSYLEHAIQQVRPKAA
jgi:hypothetical protein